MGARLRYAKVIDRQAFMNKGSKLHPGLENEVIVNGEPGQAGAFLVLRGWGDDHGTFTEQWRIEDPGGMRVYESTPREIHVATNGHVERLEDEVADLELDFAADGYTVVFTLDENEVARATFPVKLVG
ncbi:MAG: hypothetical protein ACRDKT_03050 [Actinomycetota bacterium]